MSISQNFKLLPFLQSLAFGADDEVKEFEIAELDVWHLNGNVGEGY